MACGLAGPSELWLFRRWELSGRSHQRVGKIVNVLIDNEGGHSINAVEKRLEQLRHAHSSLLVYPWQRNPWTRAPILDRYFQRL